MRHAFLIFAHDNWWQLSNLISLLDSPNHDIYIHIDRKSSGYDPAELTQAAQSSPVFLFSEKKIYWGGFSLVEAELLLLREAGKVSYDYYHLLSGADLPLCSNASFDAFFERHKGCQLLDFDEEKLQTDPEIGRRTRLYHFLQNYRRRFRPALLNEGFVFLERCLLLLQLVLGINRTRNETWTIKYGSSWCSISDELRLCILENEEKLYRLFRHTNCADELFVQTVAYNCGFMDRVYRPRLSGLRDNLRYIDWSRGRRGSPYTFTMEDCDDLLSSGALLARKFSQTVDKAAIEYLSQASRAR